MYLGGFLFLRFLRPSIAWVDDHYDLDDLSLMTTVFYFGHQMIRAIDMHHGANLLAPALSRAALYTSRAVVHGTLLPQLFVRASCPGIRYPLAPATVLTHIVSLGLFSCTWIPARSRHRLLFFLLFFRYFPWHGMPPVVRPTSRSARIRASGLAGKFHHWWPFSRRADMVLGGWWQRGIHGFA